MNRITINADAAPASAKLVTRLAAGLVKLDDMLSRVCGNYGKCEPSGCPLYPTQDEIDSGEFREGCIWANANEEFLTYIMEAYRDWRDTQNKQYIVGADDMENCFGDIAKIKDEN